MRGWEGWRGSVIPHASGANSVSVSVTPLAREGSEHQVPQWRGNAVPVPVVLEVVAHVLLAQPLSQHRLRRVVMHVVVRVVVGEVAEDEPGEDRVGRWRPEDQRVEEEEHGRERNAHGWWHH